MRRSEIFGGAEEGRGINTHQKYKNLGGETAKKGLAVILSAIVVISAIAVMPAIANASDQPQLQVSEVNGGENGDLDNIQIPWWWEQFHKNARNTGFSLSYAPHVGEQAWESEDIKAVESSQPIIANRKVFVYCEDSIKALYKSNGTVIWSTTIKPPKWGSWSSPAYDGGKIFIGSDDTVYCLSETNGAIVWVFTLPKEGFVINSAPTVSGGKVFIGDYWNGIYYCLSEDNGTELWNFTIGGSATSTPAVSKGKVFVGIGPAYGATEPRGVYCLYEENGTEVWNVTTDYGVFGSVSVSNVLRTIYACTYNFSTPGRGSIYGISKAGKVKFVKPIISSDSTPAIAYGKIYISSGWTNFTAYPPIFEKKTYCFSAITGEEVWNVSDIGSWTCSLAVAAGKVFVGDMIYIDPWMWVYNGTLALNAFTGEIAWDSKEGGSSPAVAYGKVFTISKGKVYAFKQKWLPSEDAEEAYSN